jgi:hypothetical protein
MFCVTGSATVHLGEPGEQMLHQEIQF